MLTLPDGELRWPLTGYQQYRDITNSIRQFQFIQHSVEDIEVRLVVSRALSAQEERALRAHIQKSLGHPFKITFSFHSSIARGGSGKFEEFISHLM